MRGAENVPHEMLESLYIGTVGWLEGNGMPTVDADMHSREYPIVGQVLHDMLPDAAATFAVGDELLLASAASIDPLDDAYGAEPFCRFVITPNAATARKFALYIEPEYNGVADAPVGFRTSRGQEDPIGHTFASDMPETIKPQIDYLEAILMARQLSPAECAALQDIVDHLPRIDQAQTREAANLLHDMPLNAMVLRDMLPDADPDFGATTEPRTFKIGSAALASCPQFAEWALGDGGAEIAHIPAPVALGIPGLAGPSKLVFSFSSPAKWRNIELTFCDGDVMVHDECADSDGPIDTALHAMAASSRDIALLGAEEYATTSAGHLSASEVFQLDKLLTWAMGGQPSGQ